MPHVRISDLSKNFGSLKAIDQLDLEIEKGELFFLLGPSGCGKTTLLRALAGFVEPDTGTIAIGERDVTQLPAHLRNTGMVFQNYALWPHMSVRANLAFGLELKKLSRNEIDSKVDRALEMVHLREAAERLPSQISGGQQQRVALARALVLEPEVVLLDEPLSNLDAKLRVEMRAHIQELHERLGLTMIYVTHDQEEALSLGQRIALMDNGRVVQCETPRNLYFQPVNKFAAEFIGKSNFLELEVKACSDTVELEGGLISRNFPQGLNSGESVEILVRPENIHLHPRDENDNHVKAKLKHLTFTGSREQLLVELEDSLIWQVERDSDSSNRPAEIGQEISLYFSPEQCQVFKRET